MILNDVIENSDAVSADMFIREYDSRVGDSHVLPDALADHYEIVSALDQRGRTLLVRDRLTGEQCCLKKAQGDRIEMLLREYECLRSLRHPNAPAAYGIWRDDEAVYMLREYIKGETLSEYAGSRLLDWRETAGLGIVICDIIMTLADMNPSLIHRDIKAENFIRTEAGKIILIDFDSVESIDALKNADTIVMGTPGVAPPEQYGFRRCDARTDVYSIGITLTRLLSGKNDPARLTRSAAPLSMRRLLYKCVQFQPERRYSSCEEVSRALNRCLNKGRRCKRIATGVISALTLAALLYGALPEFIPQAPARLLILYGSRPARFRSPVLAKAAAFQLDKPVEDLTVADVAGLTRLSLIGDEPIMGMDSVAFAGEPGSRLMIDGIKLTGVSGTTASLDDLVMTPNLQELAVYYSNVTSLEPLRALRSLKRLALTGCPAADFSPIASLRGLETLELSATSFSDLSILAGCRFLRTLNLSLTPITDYAPLSALSITNMRLDFRDGRADLSTLPKSLESLSIDDPTSADLQSLTALPNLTFLNLDNFNYQDFHSISQLHNLKTLWVWGSFSSLDGLEALTRLETLMLVAAAEDARVDLSPLYRLRYLSELGLGSLELDDYSRLVGLYPLLRLQIAANHEPLLPELPGVEVIVRIW
jgi:hypothetical protein